MAPQAGCAFCAIVAGAGSHVVLDDEECLAFLDHRPVFPGHCLLVPKLHVETLADLPPDRVGPLFLRARALAAAVEEGMDADGTFVALNNRVSQSVPHLHVHVVPRRKKDGLRGFFWPRLRYPSPEAMREAQERIREALKRQVDEAGPDRS
jgi:histidine triad (HIT) family protein